MTSPISTSAIRPEPVQCPDCGELITPLEFTWLDQTRWVLPACRCAVAKAEAERTAAEAQARQRERDRLYTEAELGPTFMVATFETFRRRRGTERALAAARKFAGGFPLAGGEGLILTGPVGTGKTHLAAAVAHALLDSGLSVLIRTPAAIFRRIQQSWDAGENESRIHRALTGCDLLILDDAGSEHWTEWRERTLYDIVDARYRAHRAVVVTTNCNLAELADRLGERTFDRLIERCPVVELAASSYRREVAAERAKRIQREGTQDNANVRASRMV